MLTAAALYGCWLIASHILGHAPVAWVDDPAETLGQGGVGWLYLAVTWLAIIPIVPVFIASILLNVACILKHRPSAAQAGLRLFTMGSIWLWYWVWVRSDPHEIIKWWID